MIQKGRWKEYLPHRLAFKACVLVDKTVDAIVGTTAEIVQQKTGATRSELTHTFMQGGLFWSVALFSIEQQLKYGTPFGIITATILGIPTILPYLRLRGIITKYANQLYINPIQLRVLKVARFGFLGMTAGDLFVQGPDYHTTGVLGTGTITLYLISSNRGYLDAIKAELELIKMSFKQSTPTPNI